MRLDILHEAFPAASDKSKEARKVIRLIIKEIFSGGYVNIRTSYHDYSGLSEARVGTPLKGCKVILATIQDGKIKIAYDGDTISDYWLADKDFIENIRNDIRRHRSKMMSAERNRIVGFPKRVREETIQKFKEEHYTLFQV